MAARFDAAQFRHRGYDMSDALGLSIGTTNLVAIRDGRAPVTRRSIVTFFDDRPPEVGAPGEYANPNRPGLVLTSFVERVGDPVAVIAPDGSSHRAEYVLVDALDALARTAGGGAPITIAVPAYWGPAAVGALRAALRTKPSLTPNGVAPSIIPDADAALTGLRTAPGLPASGVVVLCDFGGTGTSITLADASAGLAIIGDTVRYQEFSGELIDQALLNHVVSGIAEANDADPGSTAAVGSLARLRGECRQAKERLSATPRRSWRPNLPGYASDFRVTRAELERLIEQPLGGLIYAVEDTLQRNRIPLSRVSAVATVGGGAAIPLVTQRLSERLRAPVVTTPAPLLATAAGAFVVADRGLAPDTPTGMGPVADAPTGLATTMGWAADSPATERAHCRGCAHGHRGRAGLVAGRHPGRRAGAVRRSGLRVGVHRTDRRPPSHGVCPRGGRRPSRLGAAGLVQAAADSLRGGCGRATARRGRPGRHPDQFV